MTMNVYFAGGEDVDFILVAGAFQVPGAAHRSTWSRTGLYNSSFNNSATDPPTYRWQTPVLTAVGTLWYTAQVAWSSTGGTTNAQVIRFLDPSGVCRLMLRVAASTGGAYKISQRNAAGTITDLLTLTTMVSAIPTFTTSVCYQLVIGITNYASSGGGTVVVYANGISLGSYTGTLFTDSATQLAQVEMADNGNNNALTFSEIIVADSDTRSASLWTMNSNTAGNTQNWTGTASNPTNQSGLVNDSNFISSATAGQISEYETGGIVLPSGSYTVAAVVMAMRGLVGLTGPQHIEFVTRAGGTDYTGGSWAPSTSFSNEPNYIQQTNPNTSVAFLTSDLTASTFNFGVESAT